MKKQNLRLLIAACAALLCGVLCAPLLQAAGETGAAASPWYLSAGFFSAVIALFTGALAIWQNAEKRTAQKVSETLVLAIEEASKIPAIAEKEKVIKEKIREVNERYHVEPVVAALVRRLT
jgi:hypothetical protein